MNKKYLILRAKEAAYMYKAIEYGCMHKCIVLEHSDKPVETVAIELFVDLLSFNSMSEFIAYCLHPGSSNPRAEPDHIRNFIKSCQNIKELSSKPVPDGEHDFDVYYYELNETEKDFVKTVNLMNKNISPRLLDFVVKIDSAPNSPTFYLRKLLDSSIPEVVEKAQMWADAALNGEDLKITQGAIRRYAKQRRSENPK